MATVKRYVWQFEDNSYAIHHSRFPAMVNYHYSYTYLAYNDVDELKAKMWKTKKGAERSLANGITKAEAEITRHQNSNSYYKTASNLKIVEGARDRLKGVVVVELDLDEEDATPKRIRFKEDSKCYDHSGISTKTKGSGRDYCRICGMILKDLPHFNVGSGWKYTLTVCPLCLLEQTAKATMLLDSMDQDLRKEMESERFIRKI